MGKARSVGSRGAGLSFTPGSSLVGAAAVLAVDGDKGGKSWPPRPTAVLTAEAIIARDAGRGRAADAIDRGDGNALAGNWLRENARGSGAISAADVPGGGSDARTGRDNGPNAGRRRRARMTFNLLDLSIGPASFTCSS